ncbi:hypothetical protein QYF61_024392 [Mycteria americana]|uniref:Uncharacterized protein n=1 Tax=Mycteria americana TaxID=33587 RepID=A0AAN7NXQ0_MYCAM|nr:hypothetical protein QYF61_024392 [Mycteria americana]
MIVAFIKPVTLHWKHQCACKEQEGAYKWSFLRVYPGIYPVKIFIHDLEEELDCTLIKVVNDTKLEGAVSILEGKIAIQRNLGKLEKWADRNFVKFNKDKSKVLWLGWGNPLQQYKPILVDSRRNVSQQCGLAVLNANSITRELFINLSIWQKVTSMVMPFEKTLTKVRLFSLQKRSLWEDLIAACQYL